MTQPTRKSRHFHYYLRPHVSRNCTTVKPMIYCKTNVGRWPLAVVCLVVVGLFGCSSENGCSDDGSSGAESDAGANSRLSR